jgi:uncharacterized protein YbaR (Trm112 family)
MQRDLLDALRCPVRHEESWLVALVRQADGPALLEAELACPVCAAEYRISGGVAHFTETVPPADAYPYTSDMALRLAALLGVAESLRPIALVGRYAAAGGVLGSIVAAPQVLINSVAPAGTAAGTGTGTGTAAASRIVVADRLPLGVDTLAAIAVDAAHASPAFLESAARALRLGGRLVAPADAAVPVGMRELARDGAEWVAETTTRASGLVELRRRAPESVG